MPKRKVDFKKLQQEWYTKLKTSGFADIEHADGSINSSKPYLMRAAHQVYQDSVQEYYYLCYHFLNEHTFKSELEKVIWEYHTEGISNRQIATILKKIKINAGKDKIRIIVNQLIKIMKEKYLST